LARAYALEARRGRGGTGASIIQIGRNFSADIDAARFRALAAYKEVLALWKDADPGISILKEARAEYARLQ